MSISKEDNIHAAHVLESGGIIVCPTDTAYLLGAHAEKTKAIKKVRALKNRAKEKPFHIVVADVEMAERYAIFNEGARRLAEAFLPGALTLVLPHTDSASRALTNSLPTIGIRIPDSPVALAISKELGAGRLQALIKARGTTRIQ